MAKLRQFEIIMGSPRAVYKAGSVVTGSLILHAEQAHTYTSLSLKFSGKARVSFSRKTGGRKKQLFSDKQCFFNRNVRLLPRGCGSVSNATLEEGHHEFPFTFNLPANIPSSFECHAGHVRYCVKAKLELGWADSVAVRQYFVVFRSLDLNDHESARLPLEHEVEKSLCCLPCCLVWNKSMSARISVSKRGFVPGETIPVQWEISNVWVKKMFFTIEEVSLCRAMDQTDISRETLTTHVAVMDQTMEVEGGSPHSKTGLETVRVPVAIPTALDGCRMINVEHRLVFHVVSASPTCSLRVAVNIVIGTSPLTSQRYSDDIGESPPGYDSGFSNNYESIPGRSLGSAVPEIVGVEPPAYTPSPVPCNTSEGQEAQQETPM